MTRAPEDFSRPRFWSLPPVAFFTALLAAPLLMALIGLALTPLGLGFVVLFSIPFGAPSYLLIGAPLSWLTVLRGGRGVSRFVLAASMANLLAAPAMVLAMPPFGAPIRDAFAAALFVHGFGMVFAPLYGLLFGWVFEWLADPAALPPPPPDLDALLARKETRHA